MSCTLQQESESIDGDRVSIEALDFLQNSGETTAIFYFMLQEYSEFNNSWGTIEKY